MLIADLDLARRFLDACPPPGRLLLCAVTGAHIYGFPSPDSDLDLKGIHVAPTDAFLGLDDVQVSFDRTEDFEGVECDVTTQEAREALRLLLRGNGNMLERVLSPLQAVPPPEGLQDLARGAVCARFFRHYAGFFRGRLREIDKAPAPIAKNLLYAYRVALTGAHLLRTGELETDVNVLAPQYGFAEVSELVAFKREHGEKSALDAATDARHRAHLPRLEALLVEARDATSLPDTPPNGAALSDWLVQVRRGAR